MLIVYTGDGKGKTTSSFGVILRSLVLEKKVLMIQFMKPVKEKAIEFLENSFSGFKSMNFGTTKFIKKGEKPPELFKAVHAGLETLKREYKNYDLIVIDELCVVIYFGLLDKQNCLELIKQIKEEKDIIISGRRCTKEFIDLADIATEMKLIRHHYGKGVLAKAGIDY